jgi:serine/threonine protein kinase
MAQKYSSASSHASSKGTVRWQAPELFNGTTNTRASDIYAFGSVLYEVSTAVLCSYDCELSP